MTKKKKTTTNKPTRRLLSVCSSSLSRRKFGCELKHEAFLNNCKQQRTISACYLPGEGKVHQAEHSDCQQSDGVRLIEEVNGDILHLLLVYHSEM